MSLQTPIAPGRTTARIRAAYTNSPRSHVVAVILAGLLSAGLAGYQFAQPNALEGVHGYDDGVYLGAAVRLIHGVLPYRDFAYLHPPGMPLLLAPVAAVGELTGSPVAMLVARLLTGLAAVAVAALGAWLLRYRGLVAMLTGGSAIAMLPTAMYADQSLSLDPFFLLFCLVGAAAVFDRSGSFAPGKRRTILGGAAFGFACAIKVWALMPLVALLVVCCAVRRERREVRWLAAGIGAGAVIPALPFLCLAPAQFLHDVVITQVVRQSPVGEAASVLARFRLMIGVAGPPGLDAPGVVAAILLAILAVLATAAYVMSPLVALDWFIALAAVVIVTGMCLSRQFYAFYGYFPGVFLALLLGVTIGLTGRAASRWPRLGSREIRRMRFAVMAILLVAVVVTAPQYAAVARGYLALGYDPGPALAARIPAGSCVVTDEASLLVSAGRLSTSRGCPLILDPFGQWIADDPSHPPPETVHYAPELVRAWQGALSAANYMVEVAPESDFVPWTHGLWAYFNSRYVLVSRQNGAYLYQHLPSVDDAIKRVADAGFAPATAAARLVTIGIAAQDSGETGAAAFAYMTAAREDPRDTYAYFDLGTVAQQLRNYSAAAAAYRVALRIDPGFAPAVNNMRLFGPHGIRGGG